MVLWLWICVVPLTSAVLVSSSGQTAARQFFYDFQLLCRYFVTVLIAIHNSFSIFSSLFRAYTKLSAVLIPATLKR